MTEKELNSLWEYEGGTGDIAIYNDEKYYWIVEKGYPQSKAIHEVIDLLNALNDENEELKQHIRIVLQNELNKSDIPVWKHQYVKSLAEKLGVELNELYE